MMYDDMHIKYYLFHCVVDIRYIQSAEATYLSFLLFVSFEKYLQTHPDLVKLEVREVLRFPDGCGMAFLSQKLHKQVTRWLDSNHQPLLSAWDEN